MEWFLLMKFKSETKAVILKIWTAKVGKSTCQQEWRPEFDPWDLHGRKEEVTPHVVLLQHQKPSASTQNK